MDGEPQRDAADTGVPPAAAPDDFARRLDDLRAAAAAETPATIARLKRSGAAEQLAALADIAQARTAIAALRAELDAVQAAAIAELRAEPVPAPWPTIAARMDVTPQSAARWAANHPPTTSEES